MTSRTESKRTVALPFASTVVGCVVCAVLLPSAFGGHPALALAQSSAPAVTTPAAPVDAVGNPNNNNGGGGNKPKTPSKEKCPKKRHEKPCKEKKRCRKHRKVERKCCPKRKPRPCKREKRCERKQKKWLPAAFDFSDVVFEEFDDKPRFPWNVKKHDDKPWDRHDGKPSWDKHDDKPWGDDKYDDKDWGRKRERSPPRKWDHWSPKSHQEEW